MDTVPRYRRRANGLCSEIRSLPLRSLWPLAGLFLVGFSLFYLGSKTSTFEQSEAQLHEIEALKAQLAGSRKLRVPRALTPDAGPPQNEGIIPPKKRERRSARVRNVTQAMVETIQRAPRYEGGVTYIRWGRKHCINDGYTSTVYSGIAAGSHYTHTGGGSNILCLTMNISYTPGTYVDGSQDGSYLYGVEYRSTSSLDRLFDFSETGGNSYRLHAVPCAICMAHTRNTQLMIPGTDICPDGWTREYSGYIMGSNHGHQHTTDYVCIDRRPHVVPGSGGDQAGALLYMAETQCPSLQCEPYVDGREVPCVVCTL